VLRAAAALGLQFVKRRLVASRFRQLRRGFVEQIEQLLVKSAPCWSKLVELPAATPLVFDELRAAQIGQMPGCVRLGNSQHGDEVSNAEGAPAQQMKDADARRLRECAQGVLDDDGRGEADGFGCRHIRQGVYTARPMKQPCFAFSSST